MTEEKIDPKDFKDLLEFFKDYFDGSHYDEGYCDAILEGESVKSVLKQIDENEHIKLAVKYGVVDQDWVTFVREHVCEVAAERKKEKKKRRKAK